MKTIIIAEIGINHNRNMAMAVQLIDVAIAAKADVVKFQLEVGGDYCPTFEEMKQLWLYCKAHDMKFACTAFDIESLKFLLANTEMAFIKIASCDSDNLPLLEMAHAAGLPIIQSLLENAKHAAVSIMHKPDIRYLHVVAEYPTPPEHANLRRVTDSWCSGLSDHSGDIVMPVAAVALGAKIIECHLTLAKTLPGPDHNSSLEPNQFATMVEAIRMLEQAL